MENVNALVPINYLMTRHDWQRIWREEAVKKDCAERIKQQGFTTRQHRNVWLHINALTETVSDDR